MEIDNGVNVAIDVSGAAEETRERERESCVVLLHSHLALQWRLLSVVAIAALATVLLGGGQRSRASSCGQPPASVEPRRASF